MGFHDSSVWKWLLWRLGVVLLGFEFGPTGKIAGDFVHILLSLEAVTDIDKWEVQFWIPENLPFSLLTSYKQM